MKTFLFAALILGALCAPGCESKPAPKVETKPEVEVDAPGVHVEAGGGKGVDVQAPGVDVQKPPSK